MQIEKYKKSNMRSRLSNVTFIEIHVIIYRNNFMLKVKMKVNFETGTKLTKKHTAMTKEKDIFRKDTRVYLYNIHLIFHRFQHRDVNYVRNVYIILLSEMFLKVNYCVDHKFRN